MIALEQAVVEDTAQQILSRFDVSIVAEDTAKVAKEIVEKMTLINSET